MSGTDARAAGTPDALKRRARSTGWLALMFGALGIADAVRVARAALGDAPIVAGDWVNLAFAVALLAAASVYLRQRRRLLAAAQRAA